MVLAETRVGEVKAAAGALGVERADKTGAIVATDGHSRYQEVLLNGNTYLASNQAAQAVSVALATTYTGLVLSNPINSGKKLVVHSVGIALSVAPAAIATLGLIGGSHVSTDVVHTTPVVPRNAILGDIKTPVGKVDSAATIPTPVWIKQLGSGFTAGALYGTTPGTIPIDGEIILNPGGFLGIGALTAVTGLFSISWDEIDV